MASPIHGAAGMPTRKRRCPRCGHVQAVALLLAKEQVVCRRCGGLIPPDSGSAPGATAGKRRKS
jgi:uncharacterized paraquat-inducible protein A